MKKLIATILLLSSTSSFAQVTYLKKDQAAPYDGYHFTLDAELSNRKKLEELKTLELKFQNLSEILVLKDSYIAETNKQRDLWLQQSESLSKQLVSQQDKTFWQSLLYFGLGIASATAMAFAISHATK